MGAFTVRAFDGDSFFVDVEVDSLAIDPVALTMFIGGEEQLAAIETMTDASTVDVTATATWTTSDPEVATVDSDGLVTVVAVGSVVISAKADGFIATCPITVPAPPLTIDDHVTIGVGKLLQQFKGLQ